jgi:3-mercaptopyruvate sulfurtransferase SseA
MRHILSFISLTLLGLLVLTGCNSAEQSRTSPLAAASPATKTPADGARRVTITELKDLLAKNEALVIDVRNQASYDTAHIKGSRLIPEAEVLNHIAEFPKDKLIVTYCS